MLAGLASRTVRLSVVAAASIALGALLLPGASADPVVRSDTARIDGVQRRVAELHHQAEQASERFNTIRVQLEGAGRELHALRSDADDQADETEQLRQQVEQLVLAQVGGTGLGTTSQLLLSEDPDDVLASMAAMRSVSDQTADLLVSYENARHELQLREQQAQDQLDQIAAAKQQLASEQASIEQKADAAEDLLARLEAEALARAQAAQARAEARASRADARPPTPAAAPPTADTPSDTPADTPTPPPTSLPATGAGAIAVETALAQVGDAYVYGAAGPDAFDCSGLTMYAWAAAGVSLSHSSSIQSGQGVPVSVSDVEPGDLVFYYSPVSHVGMYIGNGMIVHASTPAAPVSVAPMDLMPIAWVRRVG